MGNHLADLLAAAEQKWLNGDVAEVCVNAYFTYIQTEGTGTLLGAVNPAATFRKLYRRK
jgi:hypothetical protein